MQKRIFLRRFTFSLDIRYHLGSEGELPCGGSALGAGAGLSFGGEGSFGRRIARAVTMIANEHHNPRHKYTKEDFGSNVNGEMERL